MVACTSRAFAPGERCQRTRQWGLLHRSLVVAVLFLYCVEQNARVSADGAATPQLREETPGLRDQQETMELREDDTPTLREDDGDLDVGGAGRDTTCPVPPEGEPAPPQREEAADEMRVDPEKKTIVRKPSFKTIEEVEEEDSFSIAENFEELVHNATVLHDPECQYWLGRCFERGAFNSNGESLIEPDPNQAAQLYMMAAENGHADAALMLGVLFEMHHNDNKAAEWFMTALELGNTAAVSRLGGLYEDAGSVEEAVDLYRQAAELGDPEGQAHLARLYEGGVGVEKDLGRAVELYRKAAEQNESSAMSALGTLYENGHGVPQDSAEAARWYTSGAKGGDPFACMHLARCYKKGIGVEKSMDEAEQWGRKAVELGLDGAGPLEDKEREEMKALRQPLMGGRPSRYTYIPVLDHPLSPEDSAERDKMEFDGVDEFDGQAVRYKYTKTADYIKMDGVLYPVEAEAQAS